MINDLAWLLENLRTNTPGIRQGVVLSRDGLKMCHTAGLSEDQADQLAAIASGIQGLSRGASAELGDGSGTVRQAMTEFGGGMLFVVNSGAGAHVAVLADEDADVGLIGHNLNELVLQIGTHLRAPRRAPDPDQRPT